MFSTLLMNLILLVADRFEAAMHAVYCSLTHARNPLAAGGFPTFSADVLLRLRVAASSLDSSGESASGLTASVKSLPSGTGGGGGAFTPGAP